jgi:RNA polymerase sigma-70 factor (ECF subfamily)
MSNDSRLFENYVRRGDLESFSALVSRPGVRMLVLLRGILNSVSDADDAFQDTWIRVIKSADRYKGGNIRAYLATVARSVAIDLLRKRGRDMRLEPLVNDEVIEIPDSSPTPDERFESLARSDDVRRALADLPEGPRQVFLMRIEAELSFREIAETMDIPVGTALTWMQVAKVKLKKILGRLK